MHVKKNKYGFTLIELMVVVSILLILMGLAMTALLNVKANEIAGVQSEFLAALNLARNEALTRGMPAIVEAQKPSVAGSEFAGGWRVGIDTNNNGLIDLTETVIRSRLALSKGIIFGSMEITGSGQIKKIQFDPRGYLLSAKPIRLKLCIEGSKNPDGFMFLINSNGLPDVKNNTLCK